MLSTSALENNTPGSNKTQNRKALIIYHMIVWLVIICGYNLQVRALHTNFGDTCKDVFDLTGSSLSFTEFRIKYVKQMTQDFHWRRQELQQLL